VYNQGNLYRQEMSSLLKQLNSSPANSVVSGLHHMPSTPLFSQRKKGVTHEQISYYSSYDRISLGCHRLIKNDVHGEVQSLN
jgi:hypothetical protein